MSRKRSTKKSGSSKADELSLVTRALGLFKRNPYSSGAALFTIFVGIPAFFASLNYIDNQLEPHYVATHGYTRDTVQYVVTPVNKVGEENQKILQSMQLDAAVGKREVANNNIKQWQFELSKSTDEHLKTMAQDSIKTSQETRDALTSQIQVLCKAIGRTTGPCK